MGFKRLNFSFGPIAAMESCWSELIVDVFFGHEIGEELGGFVVQAMEFGSKAAMLQEAKHGGIRVFDRFLFSIGYRFYVNGVAVVVVEDEDVIVATGGGNDEATRLVGAYLSGDGFTLCVDVMSAMVRTFLKNRCHRQGSGLCCDFGVCSSWCIGDDVYLGGWSGR
jgi:hypothetical protein